MEHLQEFCSSRGLALRIDRTAGLLRGVKLLGLASKNGREYPEATLARAAALYEGAKVNVNHPKGHPFAPRDYQDRLGTIRNVVARSGEGLFGDLQFNPKHALAEQLVWDAEHAPENVGFSHNVQARTAKRGDQTIVEEILAVQSVDLVADPATTRGLFECARRAGDVSPPITLPVDSAGDSRQGDEKTGRLGDSPATSIDESASLPVPSSPRLPVSERGSRCERCAGQTTELESLREQLKTLQAAQAIAHKRAAIAALLVEHNLPPLDSVGQAPPDKDKRNNPKSAIVSKSFVESLLAAPDEAAMRNLIRERAALVEQAHRWKSDAVGWAESAAADEAHAQIAQQPVSREQTLVESHTDNSLDAFLKAIRA